MFRYDYIIWFFKFLVKVSLVSFWCDKFFGWEDIGVSLIDYGIS